MKNKYFKKTNKSKIYAPGLQDLPRWSGTISKQTQNQITDYCTNLIQRPRLRNHNHFVFLLLDDKDLSLEFSENSEPRLQKAFKTWKAENLPSLERSVYKILFVETITFYNDSECYQKIVKSVIEHCIN